MKKLIKWIVRIVIALVLLIVIAAVVLPMVFDPNDHKDFIEDKIATQIGRPAHLNGEIKWKVFPWLALTFNDVTIDNAKGFKGDTLAGIKTLSARIKIMPLLSKNIEVGKVVIDEAKFDLQVARSGKSNWQSIVDTATSGGDSSSDSSSSSSGSLNIQGVILSNITLNYNDSQTKTKANISNLNLTLGEINASTPLDIASSMHINMPDTGMDIDFSADIVAKNVLSNAGITLDISNFDVKGKLSGDSKQALNLSLSKAGFVDLGKDTLSLPEILLTLGDAEITSNINGKNISKTNRQLSGDYRLNELDLNDFVKQLSGIGIVTTDVLDDFSSNGSWSFSGKRLKIPTLNIAFADTTIKGSADIKNLDRMAGTFNVDINKLNVDDFLGEDEGSSSSSSSSSTSSDLDFGHLNGRITIGSLTASGAKLDNIKVEVKTNGSKFELVPVNADFYQGLLSTSVKVDTKATTNKVVVNHKMNKIQAGPLLADLAGSEMLTGIGDLSINLNIDKPFSEIPLKSAHGKINYTLSDGAIYGVDVFGMMQKGLGMLYPELKQNADEGVKKTNFALMQIDADINQGILTTNILKIESPYLQVLGEVRIDLINMTIDGTIEPMLLDIPEQLVSDKYKKLLNLAIPVTLSGSLLEPKISIDAKKLLLATQKERIEKEKDKLKGKLIDSLFGKKDKKKSKENSDKTGDKETTSENKDDTKEEEPKKKESTKDKLKKDLLKGLLGGG